MGNTQSLPIRNERRHRNRLSKPPGSRVILRSIKSQHIESDGNSLASSSSVASSVRTSIHAESLDLVCNRGRVQSLPPFILGSDGPQMTLEVRNSCHISRSNSDASLFAFRHASFDQATSQDTSSLLLVPEHPNRFHSLHSAPQGMSGVMHGNDRSDEPPSSSCYLVDNQRFSLIRRQSLLTQPGVATRRPSGTTWRLPSPIGWENESACDYSTTTSRSSRWWRLPKATCSNADLDPPLPEIPFARTGTPSECEYTHLGALRLGSLRIVNGSASPCPSDRTPVPPSQIPTSEPRQEDDEYTMQSSDDREACQDSTSRSSVDMDPWSMALKSLDNWDPSLFDRSLKISISPIDRPLSPRDTGDDGIAHCDDEKWFESGNENNFLLEKTAAEDNSWIRSSSSLAHVDSGYWSDFF